MEMLRRSIVTGLFALPLLAGGGEARSLTMHHYAYGMPLQVDGDGAIYSLFLPHEVYRNTVETDLADLQIFNGHGEPVPQLLLQPVAVSEGGRQLVGTRLYPLPNRSSAPLEEEAPTSIGNERPLIDFYGGELPLPGAGAGEYFLVDASHQAGRVSRMHLHWSGDSAPLITRVSVDVSDDLSHWRPLLERQGIASLQWQGYHLDHHILELAQGTHAKYYRIHWPPGSRGVPLQGVKLELQQVQQGQTVQRLTPIAAKDDSPCYEFNLEGHFPVDGARVVLPQTGLALEGALLSRASSQQVWQPRYRGLFYDLEREGERLRSNAIALAPLAHAQWCLQLDGKGLSLGGGEPALELAWRPQRLLFVAHGEMPFTLAFGRYGGSVTVPLNDSRLRRIGENLGQLGVPKPAIAGALFELGGAQRLMPPEAEVRVKEWIVWLLVLLVLCAVLLMRMKGRGNLR